MRVTVALILTLLVVTPSAHAGLIVVDVNGTGDHATLQAGLSAAADGDTVLVLAGLYAGAGNRDLGFGTKNITLVSEMGSFWTIIDNQSEAGHRLFDFNGTGQDTTCLVSGFAIRGGRVFSEDGAGVRCVASRPKFTHCIFEDNVATDGDGGAVAVAGGSDAVFRYCTFSENEADRGGALHASGNSDPKMGVCEFDGNAAMNEGGALYIGANSGIASVVRCLFHENVSTVNGGALTCEGGSVTATGCTFVRNTAGQGGGAVHATGGANAYITGCTFVANEAALQGGCVRASAGTYWCILSQCIIAFTGPCAQRTVYADGTSGVTINYSCAYANTPGDNLPQSPDDYFVADPLFCDVTADDLTLASDSPCLPDGNGWTVRIGAYGQGCVESSIEQRSWGSIKAMYRAK